MPGAEVNMNIPNIISWLNTNSGLLSIMATFVSILAVFISYYLGKISDKKKRIQTNKDLKDILAIELMANLEFLTSIRRIHDLNKESDASFQVPTRTPRLPIIENLYRYEQISSLNKEEKYYFSNVFGKLTKFNTEYYIYRDYLYKGLITNHFDYEQISTPMMNTFDSLMESMMWLWSNIVQEVGSNSIHPMICSLNNEISQHRKKGKKIMVSYDIKNVKKLYRNEYDQAEVILCWLCEDPNIPQGKIVILAQEHIPKEGI
jgi:hypothetical protein